MTHSLAWSVQNDDLAQSILDYIKKADGPLGTREVESAFPTAKRAKIMYRLKALQAQGLIKGRFIHGGWAGSWVWWVQYQRS